MIKNAINKIGGVDFDGLIIGNYPVADVFRVTIAKNAGELKRGSVLAHGATGTATLMANDGAPFAILADDVTVGATADEVAMAYRSGKFALDKLIVATGYTLTNADLEALRNKNIIVDQTMPGN